MRRHFKTPDLFSTKDIARLLGVDYTTVIGWCEKGKLPSFKTPGGHRRVYYHELVQFLRTYNLPIPPELKSADGLRCVIVDDEAVIRTLAVRVVRQIDAKAKIEEAGDGFTAGQKISDILPQLVILDLNLPGLDGFRVCEHIRQDKRLAQAKILAITGRDTVENKKKILNAGADDYLAKPFDAKTLKSVLLKLLQHLG
jgi:two-component system, OmpR family, response regulator